MKNIYIAAILFNAKRFMIHSARNYLWVSLYYEINIKGFKEPYMSKGANIDWDEL